MTLQVAHTAASAPQSFEQNRFKKQNCSKCTVAPLAIRFFVDMVDGVDVVGGGSHNFRAFAAARLGFPYNNTLKKSASSVSSADKIAVSSLLAFKPTFPLRFG
ncbi:MAG TPA: hypothetical protein PLE92_13280 [Lentisphaeria bacterium]|nr:hypothetical protein [Lentisphaerota bacterium]HPY89241.1 hypothetical protein [Lentisphaeria bacterium]HQC54105.1 hypothetical protein [Lentisphaeria bacterium]HQL87860.1 hypothetical protein [Lentisphaeria bacterium]